MKYKTNNKILRKILKENLILIIGMIILYSLITFIRKDYVNKIDLLLISIIFIIILILNLPAIIIYISYYLENRNTELEIDENLKSLKVSQNGKEFQYSFNEIETSEYNIGYTHKNINDNGTRYSYFLSHFGYWKLTFTNGDRYYLTTLIQDFLLEKPKIKNTKIKYRIIPYIDKSNSKKLIKKENKTDKELIKKYLVKFKSKTEKELKYIMENKTEFQKEVIIATEKLLNKNGW